MKYIILIFLASTTGMFSQGTVKEAAITESLNELIADLEIPGMSVAVSQNGEMIYEGSFGYRDLKKELKVDEETLFRTASTCKLFASAAIAVLLQEGKLELDDPIEKYVQDFPHVGKGVTIRRILNHTSGVRHYGKGDRFIDAKNYETTDDALDIFMHDDLLSEPGTTYKYSTHAFTLLAAIVERISGMSYTDYLQQNIFKPLKMDRTRPDVKGERDENQSQLYKGMKKSLVDNPSYKRAGGGMLSTARDLVKFGNAHLKAGFFNEATLALIKEPTLEMPGTLEPTQVGMAWRISKDAAGQKIIHHAGNMNGARSFLMISPADGTVVAIMTNNRELDFIETLACGIRDVLVHGFSETEKNLEYDKATLTLMTNKFYTNGNLEVNNDKEIAVNLICNYTPEGQVYRNLKVYDDLLYMIAGSENLRLYMKDQQGAWKERIISIK